ncbi:MAG: hypothetical protein KJP03_07165 [Gammaproteobacteria bacterium]|nr:hypothetical protein [Gammaproteobacteria bacterium]
MQTEKIKVVATDTDTVLEVVVFRKQAERIEVILGEGVHSVRCTLTPTSNGRAYSGSAMGREIVYQRSPDQVRDEIERLHPTTPGFRKR